MENQAHTEPTFEIPYDVIELPSDRDWETA